MVARLLAVALCAILAAPSGAARALAADTAAAANGGAAHPGCPPDVEAALDSAMPDEYGGPDELIFWASNQSYAGGMVRGYTKLFAGDGACFGPAAVGVEISKAVLEGVPGPEGASMQPPPECKTNSSLPQCFPPFDEVWVELAPESWGDYRPFQVMGLNWEPSGHPTEGVYTIPHFDFHFYMISEEEVMNITGGPCRGMAPDVFTAANQPIPDACFPGGNYSNSVDTVPGMGNHFLSDMLPEIKAAMEGQNAVAAWNMTWIYGGYDGKITFFEPMAKRAYLLSSPNQCWAIPAPPREYPTAGFMPHTYCVHSTDKGVRVELRDFSWYPAGCQDGSMMAAASYGRLPEGSPPLAPECLLPTA